MLFLFCSDSVTCLKFVNILNIYFSSRFLHNIIQLPCHGSVLLSINHCCVIMLLFRVNKSVSKLPTVRMDQDITLPIHPWTTRSLHHLKCKLIRLPTQQPADLPAKLSTNQLFPPNQDNNARHHRPLTARYRTRNDWAVQIETDFTEEGVDWLCDGSAQWSQLRSGDEVFRQ